jgi:hypothetical protein
MQIGAERNSVSNRLFRAGFDLTANGSLSNRYSVMEAQESSLGAPHPRYTLLPKWIRFIFWIEFLISGLVLLIYLLAIYSPLLNPPGHDGPNVTERFFGFYYSGPVYQPIPLLIYALEVFFLFAAFALLWGFKYGVRFGLISGYILLGLLLLDCYRSGISFNEAPWILILLQIVIIFILTRRRGAWEAM